MNSPARLRVTLAMVAVFVLGMTVLAVLQYHNVIHLPGMARVEQHGIDSATNETTVLVRLCGIGLFNDPNDLSLVLVISIIVCGYFLTEPALGRRARQFLLFPLALFFYAFTSHTLAAASCRLRPVCSLSCAPASGDETSSQRCWCCCRR